MELKRDNQGIKMRLGKIEAKLDVDVGYNDENGEKQQKKQLVSEEKSIVSEEKLIVSEEKSLVDEEEPIDAEEKLSVSEEETKIKSTLDKTKIREKGLKNL